MKRGEILDEAKRLVTKDREEEHGEAQDIYDDLASLWSMRLKIGIDSGQVMLMMNDLKSTRAWHMPRNHDNYVDMAGYAALAGELYHDRDC